MKQDEIEILAILTLWFAILMLIVGYLVFVGVRITFFHIPMSIFGLTIQHELSLIICVLGSISGVALMVAVLQKARPRQMTRWDIYQ